jgi:hypothetical protein
MVVLGFDPGGVGQFGWCVAEAAREGRIKIRKSGNADSAAEAYSRSLEWVGDKTEIAAAPLIVKFQRTYGKDSNIHPR